MNATDLKIQKLWRLGLTIPRIAARIGRPGDHGRVREGLLRCPECRELARERGVVLSEPVTEGGE